jgi:serine/threonine-protein kinase
MARPTVTQALVKARATGWLSSRSFDGLSPELQAQAAYRLGSIAGLLAALFVLTSILRNIVFQIDPAGFDRHTLAVSNAFSAAYVAAAFAMYVYARRTKNNQRALRVGLLFEVLTCLGVALFETWYLNPHTGGLRLSLIAIFILIFPAAVPARTGVRLVITTLSFLTLPFSLWLASTRGHSIEHVGFLLLPTFIAAVGAIAVSRVVHGLSVQLSEAHTLGAYQLVDKIGQGGMGEVWLAKHRMLARPAAIKLITPEALGDGADVAIRRFEREAQATSVLRSPHTVELYDFGISEDGTFYYAMELLEGRDLETLVEEHGPLTPGHVAHIMRQVCRSLADAHYHRLIHRDIKPANIFLCRLGPEVDFVKVLDFGLVKAESEVESKQMELKLSKENMVAGTPAYMAPEVALSQEVGPGIDIYALGCVGYFLLTGELVFTGKTAIDVALKHVKDVPVPPSDRTEMKVPGSFEAIIMACLEKEPAARPRSALALELALDAIAGDVPWTTANGRAWWKTHLPELLDAPAPFVSSSLGPPRPSSSP